jgi:uncharacterized protein YbjT (DUF2867 family)
MRPTEALSDDIVFVTGATGYIGGRLVPLLLGAGYRVRCLARDPKKLESRAWAADPGVEIVQGSIESEHLPTAMSGCRAAYYLVHSMMAAGPEYAHRDQQLAEAFAEAATTAGCQQIVYLGGLGETGGGLSEHLQSRRDVERALSSGSVPVTTLRAAMIIGAGSASFEILRYLVERLPVMVTPKWVSTECQPIAVRNVLFYLVAAIDEPRTLGQAIDIGGPEILTYRQILDIMAECLGLSKRWIIPVPVLTPRLSSMWIHLVTPLSRHIARPLAEGLKNRVVCQDNRAQELMPQNLLSVREAIEAALGNIRGGEVETSWSDAGSIPGDPDWAGGTIFDNQQQTEVGVSVPETFAAVCSVGGTNGWYAANFLWRVRGWIDRLVGGPGLRRGRRNADTLNYGDAVDFWRVVEIEPNRRLGLRAEMKLPGEAELEFEVLPIDGHDDRCQLVQTARFKPHGLAGILYWYAVMPFHHFVFSGMLNGIARKAHSLRDTRDVAPS